MALAFVMQIDEIDRVIIGMNNVEQLNEILQMRGADLGSIDLHSISVNDQKYTNPSCWKI